MGINPHKVDEETGRLLLSHELEEDQGSQEINSSSEYSPEDESSTEDVEQPKREKATNTQIIDKLKNPVETLKGAGQEFAGQKPGWGNPAAYPAAAGAGLVDFGIGLVNKVIPGEDKDIPALPQYQHEGLQAVRDISSVVIPTIYLAKFGIAKGLAGHSKVGWKLGNDAFVKWISTTGINVGAGITVDEIAPVQERDHNAAGWLKQAWPQTWGWIPDDYATLDSDSSDVKRQKNRNEGAGIGFFSDLLVSAARLAKAQRGIQHATSWVPKNEQAKNWLKKKNKLVKLSDDPVENDLLHSTKRRDDELTELGKSKVDNDPTTLNKPTVGVHNMFDYGEQGVRSSDADGIVGAGVDQVKIVKNIDTRYGRLSSIFSPKTINEVLTGKQNLPERFRRDERFIKTFI